MRDLNLMCESVMSEVGDGGEREAISSGDIFG